MIIREKYNNIATLFLAVFNIGIKNGGITLVVVDESVLMSEFILFLEERKAPLVNDINTDYFGFLVTDSLLDDLSMMYVSSVIEIRTLEDKLPHEEVSDDTYYFIAELKSNPETDYWEVDVNKKEPYNYPSVNCYLMNDQLKPMFLNTFQIAEKEIDLICPWMNRKVINEEMILRFRKAISRGVKIKICYGIGKEVSDNRQIETERTVEMLKKRFSDTKLLFFNKGNTHIKYLICDDKYMMTGSYNLLSFAADYVDDDVRDEGMDYITDKAQIRQRRELLFSWE